MQEIGTVFHESFHVAFRSSSVAINAQMPLAVTSVVVAGATLSGTILCARPLLQCDREDVAGDQASFCAPELLGGRCTVECEACGLFSDFDLDAKSITICPLSPSTDRKAFSRFRFLSFERTRNLVFLLAQP